MLPTLGSASETLVRAGYGVLMLATLVTILPHARRFFLSSRWGGYGLPSREVDALQNPLVLPPLLALWFACAALIAAGWLSPWPELVNLLLCYYFFIRMRWRSVLRGMGAPGYVAYWLGAAVLMLALTRTYLPSLRPLALLTLQIDFAVIIFLAGVYKIAAGYPRNVGMELGLANPEWGYHWRLYKQLRPDHFALRALNQLAWLTEVVAGLLMLIPATRTLGGLLLTVTFAFIATQLRLGMLCPMVMLIGVLYFSPDSIPERVLSAWLPTQPAAAATSAEPSTLAAIAGALIVAYLVLLPFAYGGLAFNLYARRRLPPALQRALERYTNLFGMILWRVFSADIVNFFVQIYRQDRASGARVLVSTYDRFGIQRFNSVAECIAVTTVFTTLKYFPDDADIFAERLSCYARTIPCPEDSVLLFEYVAVEKDVDRFDFVPIAEFVFDPLDGSIAERTLVPTASVRAKAAGSPIHRAARPGSYAPAAR
jgi:hypothetical protein